MNTIDAWIQENTNWHVWPRTARWNLGQSRNPVGGSSILAARFAK